MPDLAISIRDLGKRYRLSHNGVRPSYRTLRESLTRAATAPLRRLRGQSDETSEEFWALDNVSMEIRPGEVVGVIGRNGAGKSTLLKILSRITKPTSGEVWLRGRVGSLLEVGTGFHPELTGRENIFLNGAILGMSRQEIRDKFEAIVDFAGTERFLDTPVKHYSSGMSMRLAFAVAAQLEPEVLLIDEVLAVGDGDFQKKCLGRMGDLATAGRTIVFVSHNLTAVRTLCQTAVWLERGKVMLQGPVSEVVNGYVESAECLASERVWQTAETAPGNNLLRLHRVRVAPSGSTSAKSISVETPIDIDFELWNLMSESSLNLSLVVYSLEGNCIFNSLAPAATVASGLFRSRCRVPGNLLNDGVFSIRLLVAKDQATVIFDVYDLATFEVHDIERPILWFGKMIGAVRPQLDWTIEPGVSTA
jgi:lipopolysaccharide transport system ATP-binding protein